MLKYQLILSAQDIKRLKIFDEQDYVYYLSIGEENGSKYFTQGVDIVRTEGRFYFSVNCSQVSVEIWRYSRCRRVATLFVDAAKLKHSYYYAFSKANLKLAINLLEGISSNVQEESKNYQNQKTLSIQSSSPDSEQGVCILG